MSASSAGIQPAGAASDDIDVAGIGRAISRRIWLIVVFTLLCAAAMTVFVNIIKPRYTAEARLLVENQESYFTRPEKSTANDFTNIDPEGVSTQVQIVTSRDVGRKVVRDLNLQGNPEFDPLAEPSGPISRVAILLGLKRDPTRQSPEDRILEAYLDKLTAFSPPKTRVISIEFQSKDPDLAAAAANKIAEAYIATQRETKRASAKSAAGALQSLIADLRVKVAHAEAEAESFRAKHGLLPVSSNVNMTTQQLADTTTQLSSARNAQADAQAKAKLIRDMIRQVRVSEVPDVAANDLVRRLSEQRATLRAQIASESRTLLEGHPRMQELIAQLRRVDLELTSAADKAARTLENDARLAGARVQNLQASLEKQKQVSGVAGADEVQLREFERTARLLKDQLESATARYQEAATRDAANTTPADARIISYAVAPQNPTFPKKMPLIAFALLGGLVASMAYVVAAELLTGKASSTTARAVEYVEYVAPAPAVVVEPKSSPDASSAPAVGGPPDGIERRSLFSRVRRAGKTFSAPKEPMIDIAPAPVATQTPAAAPAPTTTVFTPQAAASAPASAAQPSSVVIAPAQPAPQAPGAMANGQPQPSAPASMTFAPKAPGAAPRPQQVAAPQPAVATAPQQPTQDVARELSEKIVSAQVAGRATRVLFAGVDIAEAGGVALPVARALTREGQVVAIDLDRERPSLAAAPHAGTGPAEGVGLSDLLNGAASFEQVLHRDRASRLHIVQAGARPIHDLLAVDATVEALSATYDFVVLIAPSLARDDLAESIGGMADVAVIVAPSRGADKSTRAAFEGMLASGAGEVLVVDHMRAAKA
mgnify:CR=1 FL=1